jgi:hypothetical protein
MIEYYLIKNKMDHVIIDFGHVEEEISLKTKLLYIGISLGVLYLLGMI